MKNKFSIIIPLVGTALLSSCVHYTEDIFDKPASERIAESIQAYQNLLVGQTNGWLVEYYPESTQKYGGYNLYFKFEDQSVTVKSEIDPSVSSESLYSIGSDMGPTINFDTYNTLLHYFSDPAFNQGGGYGLNYEGDYEFLIINGSETEFILKGKKTKNTIRMTPLPADLSWNDYVQSIKAMEAEVIVPAYRMTVDGREIYIQKSPGARFFMLRIGNDVVPAPFIVTPAGIKLYQPVTILDKTLQFFTYNHSEDKIVEDSDNSIISFVYPPLNQYFLDNLTITDWFFQTADIGPGYLTAWNTAKADLENKDGEELYMMWLGTIDADYPPGVSFASWDYSGDRAWYGTYVYNFETAGENRVTFLFDSYRTSTEGVNASYYASRLMVFAGIFNGQTFTIEPDVDITTNPKNITKITKLKFTDVANPDNWFTVGLNTVIRP
ncbi:MAG: DUF4302 domain-containing protein [Bacteroidales bacterium]|jgi:hypothetical protein|nr:DUF4302 domain-containing protein [Bacteroidales bacterium]